MTEMPVIFARGDRTTFYDLVVIDPLPDPLDQRPDDFAQREASADPP